MLIRLISIFSHMLTTQVVSLSSVFLPSLEDLSVEVLTRPGNDTLQVFLVSLGASVVVSSRPVVADNG